MTRPAADDDPERAVVSQSVARSQASSEGVLMTIRRRTPLAVAAVFILVPLSTPAHHALNEVYERDSSISLTGTVIRVDWVNPHASFTLSVSDLAGSTVEWIVELDPPHILQRSGWSREAILAGQAVTVEGFRALDGGPRTYARTVALANGEILPASSDGSWNWRRID
jgi:hypothetical protein